MPRILTTICICFFIVIATTGYLLYQESQTYYQQQETLRTLLAAETKNCSDASLAIFKQLEQMRQEFRLNTTEIKSNNCLGSFDMVKEISILFTATYDGDVYRFLDALAKQLNGHLILKSFELKRAGKISQATLIQIENGQLPALIEGQLQLYWIQPANSG